MLTVDDRRSSRVDDERGIVESARFFGEPGRRLFGVLHSPVSETSLAVVMCPSILTESQTSYGTEVSLARELAANGVAALRFHYRGTGHSDGADEEMTFGTMREDALAAASHVLEELSPLRVAFLGTRLGALFAASAAARHEGAPLILWEPVLEARRYFREAWRARAIFGIKEGTPQAGKSLVDVLAAEGVVDVLGYPVYPALYESAIERTLLEEAGGGTRPVLNVQGAGSAARQADLERMTEALRTNGCPVDVEVLPFEIVWWFLGPARIREVQPHVSTLVARTSSWLQQLEGGSAP